MNCNYRRLLNRVRYWQYIPLTETQTTKSNCRKGLTAALADRSKILSNTDADPKYTWTTEPTGELSEEKVAENSEKVNSIISFLDDWENLDERLYDIKGGRTNIINEFTRIAKTAMEVYYWYHRMGDEAMEQHGQDKTW